MLLFTAVCLTMSLGEWDHWSKVILSNESFSWTWWANKVLIGHTPCIAGILSFEIWNMKFTETHLEKTWECPIVDFWSSTVFLCLPMPQVTYKLTWNWKTANMLWKYFHWQPCKRLYKPQRRVHDGFLSCIKQSFPVIWLDGMCSLSYSSWSLSPTPDFLFSSHPDLLMDEENGSRCNTSVVLNKNKSAIKKRPFCRLFLFILRGDPAFQTPFSH